MLWSSEDLRYGGTGTPPAYGEENWRLPGRVAIVMQPVPCAEPDLIEDTEPTAESHD
jgi:hypothetical protein